MKIKTKSYQLHLPDEINDKLNSIAYNLNITKAEAIQKAFALLALAIDEKQKGNSLVIFKDNKIIKNITGL